MKVVGSALLLAVALPLAVSAAQTASAGRMLDAATQLPDTTYRVTIDQVQDPTHIIVSFSNGERAVLSAGRPNMTFAAMHVGDSVMLSTSKGTVLVFKDLGAQTDAPNAASTP